MRSAIIVACSRGLLTAFRPGSSERLLRLLLETPLLIFLGAPSSVKSPHRAAVALKLATAPPISAAGCVLANPQDGAHPDAARMMDTQDMGSQWRVQQPARQAPFTPRAAADRAPPEPASAPVQAGATRMRTAIYDPNESIFSVVLRYHGTLLPMVLAKPLFWLMIGINATLLFLHDWLISNYGEDHGLKVLEWEAAAVSRREPAHDVGCPPRSPWLTACPPPCHPCTGAHARSPHCALTLHGLDAGAHVAAHLLHCLLRAASVRALLPVLLAPDGDGWRPHGTPRAPIASPNGWPSPPSLNQRTH